MRIVERKINGPLSFSLSYISIYSLWIPGQRSELEFGYDDEIREIAPDMTRREPIPNDGQVENVRASVISRARRRLTQVSIAAHRRTTAGPRDLEIRERDKSIP